MELPRTKQVITDLNPRFLIIMSKPKMGKTTLLEGLDDCLHVDFEKGGDFVETQRVQINSTNDLLELFKALAAAKKGDNLPYKYIALDTATSLEEIALEVALINYRKLPIGKNYGLVTKDLKTGLPLATPYYEKKRILDLPDGAGL